MIYCRVFLIYVERLFHWIIHRVCRQFLFGINCEQIYLQIHSIYWTMC